jgi:lysophospholipase L1-like esterase
MPVLIVGDSHLARARPRHAEISPATTSRAIGGACATDLLRQVGGLSPSAYDVVLVSIGTNDAGWRDVPLPEFLASVEGFLAWAGSTPVVLMTSPGCDEARAVDHWSDARLASYAAEAGTLVKAAGGRVFDTPGVLAPLGPDAFVDDGFHLTQAAYDVLLLALADAVRS